jgi:hypothetical protein
MNISNVSFCGRSTATALPRRRGGQAADRVNQFTALLIGLPGSDATVDQLAFRKSL